MRSTTMVLLIAGILVLLLAPAQGQYLEQQSGSVVFLQEKEQQFVIMNDGRRVPQEIKKSGTGFLVADDHPLTLFLVTAQHVASDMKSERTVTIRGDNDSPINMTLEALVGGPDVRWVFHDKEDVAVVVLHPVGTGPHILQRHFMPASILLSDATAPSRDRTLTTLGFTLAIGIEEHFSPISREPKPASGLLTLVRPDTNTRAVFFLLDNLSIGGFSGAPLFLFPTPYASGGAMVFPETSEGAKCVGLINGDFR